MPDSRGLGDSAAETGRTSTGRGNSLIQGHLTDGRGIPQTSSQPIERLEVYPEEDKPYVRFQIRGGSSFTLSWTSGVPEATVLPAGVYLTTFSLEHWELSWNGAARVAPLPSYSFTKFRFLPEALARSVEATTGPIPTQVVRERRTSRAASSPLSVAGTPGGNLAFPLHEDPEALERSQDLRDLAWQLLEHFLGAPSIRGRRVSRLDIDMFAAQHPAAHSVLARMTQAWSEMQRTHDPTIARFRWMAELIAEQYLFGNETIVANALAIREEPLGLGLYHRGTGLKYYDERGFPVLDLYANRRDVYYAASERPVFRYAPATRDWATLKLLQMMGGDAEAVAVAEGYWANADLFASYMEAPELDKIFQSMWAQTKLIMLFLAMEGVVVLLDRIGTAREKVIAKLIHVGLIVTGRYFQIRFVYGLKEVLFQIGQQLYRVNRRPDGTLDDLSHEHLEQASKLARPLLEEIAGLALAAGGLRVAQATAPFLDPPGGPGAMMFVPAPATAGAGGVPAVRAVPGNAAPSEGGGILVLMGAQGHLSSAEEQTPSERKPRTPRELEEQTFAPDQLPDTPTYFSRRNKALRTTLKALLAHITDPRNQQFYKPPGKLPVQVDPEVVNIRTLDFLREQKRPDLVKRYWELSQDAQREVMRSRGKGKNAEEMADELAQAIDAFGLGNLGDKRPDKIEFLIDRKEFATTDASFVWYEPFHNFKHQVYVLAIQAATDMVGAGLEWETQKKSRLMETDKPAAKGKGSLDPKPGETTNPKERK